MSLIIRDKNKYWDLDVVLDEFNALCGDSFFKDTKRSKMIVDTDKFDIIPKESYKKELIAKKEEEIAALEREWESTKKYFEERKKRLEEERERLIRRSPTSP